jgi:hypothetical protein
MLYLGLAIFLFLFAKLIGLENTIARLVFHNLLIAMYIGLVYSMEKSNLKFK